MQDESTSLLGTFAATAIRWEWVEAAVEFCRVEGEAEAVEQWCLLLESKAVARGRRKLVKLSLQQRSGEKQYQVHPLLREFFAGKLVGEGRQAIKTAVARVITEVAKQIPPTPTLEIIGAVTGAIPHLQAVAEDLKQVKRREECGIPDDDDLIWVFLGISRFYQGQGLYADAEPWLQDCVDVMRSLLGERHPAVATSLNNLAGLYDSQGRYEDAEPLYLQALDLTRSLLGERHPAVATSLWNLAVLYVHQNRFTEAERLYIQAIEIYNQRLGEAHPYIQRIWNYFISFLRQVIQNDRTAELSDHPLTRSLLQQLQNASD